MEYLTKAKLLKAIRELEFVPNDAPIVINGELVTGVVVSTGRIMEDTGRYGTPTFNSDRPDVQAITFIHQSDSGSSRVIWDRGHERDKCTCPITSE